MPATTQNPSPAEAWFCDHVPGAESLQLYVPLITTGVAFGRTTRQIAFGGTLDPSAPDAFQNPTGPAPLSAVLVPVSPTNPGADVPFPLFQWYVWTAVTQ